MTAQNVRLEIGGELVAGTLTLSDEGLRSEFIPEAPLQPLTTYTLGIASGVLDIQGDRLEEETRVTFTTEDSAQVIESNCVRNSR